MHMPPIPYHGRVGSGGNAVRFGTGIDRLVHDATSLNFNAVSG